MRMIRHAALFICIGLAACGAPTGSSSLLAGSWRTVAIPSGCGIDLSLMTTGNQVVGTGHEYALLYLADTLTVRGSQKIDGTFRLDLTFGSGASATYSGRLVGQHQLDGTWTDAGHSPYSLSF